MTELITTGGSLAELTRQHLLLLTFPDSNAASIAGAINLAHQADLYQRADLNRAAYHLAAFGIDRLYIAESILRYLRTHPGLQVFVRGRAMDANTVLAVLSCYQTALECEPTTLHCHVAVAYDDAVQIIQSRDLDFSLDLPPAALIHPCRYLVGQLLQNGPGIPSLTQQLNATASRMGCRWCPLFNPESLTEI